MISTGLPFFSSRSSTTRHSTPSMVLVSASTVTVLCTLPCDEVQRVTGLQREIRVAAVDSEIVRVDREMWCAIRRRQGARRKQQERARARQRPHVRAIRGRRARTCLASSTATGGL